MKPPAKWALIGMQNRSISPEYATNSAPGFFSVVIDSFLLTATPAQVPFRTHRFFLFGVKAAARIRGPGNFGT